MSISGAGNRVPDYQREIKELRAEVRKLWQALANGPAMPPVQKQMPFSWSGYMGYSQRTSGPWYAEANLFITGCTLGGGSSIDYGDPTDTIVVELLVNAVSVHTFYLPVGASRGGAQVRTSVRIGDKVQLRVDPNGGSDLTALLSYVTDVGW